MRKTRFTCLYKIACMKKGMQKKMKNKFVKMENLKINMHTKKDIKSFKK